MAYYYDSTLWVAAHTAVFNEITGGVAAPLVRIRDASNNLLAEASIDVATSTINGTSGLITLAIDTQEDAAPAGGTASYAQLLDGDGVVRGKFDCKTGTSPEAGYCVMNTTTVVVNAPVDILSFTIPAGPTIV